VGVAKHIYNVYAKTIGTEWGTKIISRNSIFDLIELNFLPQHRVRNHLKDFQLSLELQ
jgi:hypothetical protein